MTTITNPIRYRQAPKHRTATARRLLVIVRPDPWWRARTVMAAALVASHGAVAALMAWWLS